MREVPECLSRRYRALDELIKELTRPGSRGSQADTASTCCSDAGIKLLCDFWNILKEDPDYDLVHAVQQRMGLAMEGGHAFHPEAITCYMAGKCCKKDDVDDQTRDAINKIKKMCGSGSDNNGKCCASKSGSPASGSGVLPLSKVLCNLKEAASFDKKCNARISELMDTQKALQEQIQHLEHREKEGVQLLKQADCMWTCMEETYQKKINESMERQNALMQQLKEVEASAAKWRKNKKDLELQLVSVGKCHEEIKEKINQKNSDLKCMDVEIEDFKKRIENNKKDTEAVKKSFSAKKQGSDAKIAKIAAEISKMQKAMNEEKNHKSNKEQEGAQYVKEARAELQKICKVLLQKKIENEDLRAEKEALNFELDVLKQTCDQCKDRCKNRQQDIAAEIAKVEKQIKEFKVKCTRCHECTDTVDIRKCCTDCPKCLEERDCLLEKDHCTPDHTMDCVCMSVKQKFLDNVFDNMYTVLEKQVKTGPGKAVADVVLKCLKRSRNGKLDPETRKILQDFILTTVKKNLNLTIVGGAVKTRCEMDTDTYNQLMNCLQQVKVVRPPKEDKATPAKKDSCRRWGGTNECNCPKGPKACICLKKAPPPPQDPSPCPPPVQDKEDEGVAIACPHRESGPCGTDCAMHSVPSRVGADIAAWRPDPCKEPSCRFSKNMRAAQCMLGPESLISLPKGYTTTIPYVPDIQDFDDLMTCKCGRIPTKPCNCQDRRSQPRERIIEEVLGRYGDLPPIDKVNSEDEFSDAESNRRTNSAQNDTKSSNIKEDSKQLKAGIVKPCDKVTCGTLWDEAKEKAGRSYSLIEKEIAKENYNEHDLVEDIKKVPSVQTDVFSEAHRHLSTEISLPSKSFDTKNVTFDNNTKESKSKERFKVIIDGNEHSSGEFTELTTTASGKLAIELDEKVIELIEEKSNENPNIFVSLDETDSGHYIINFSPSETHMNKKQRITIKKSPSGTRILQVQKEFVNKLQHHDEGEKIMDVKVPECDTKKEKGIYESSCDCRDKQHSKHIFHKKSDTKQLHDQKVESNLFKLQNLWKDGTKDIMMKVMGRNDLSQNIKGTLFKTSSGNIAVDVTAISTFGDLTFEAGKCPALLVQSAPDTFLLKISEENNYNASLKRSTLGNILLYTPESLEAEDTQQLPDIGLKNEFFKVRVKSSNKFVQDPPAVLKMTSSHTFTFVLDKEYEKQFKETIDECIGNDSECLVELNKTHSGNFLVTLDSDEMDDLNEHNALLKKTPSGHLKVQISEQPLNIADSKSSRQDSITSSKAFEHLLDMLPPSNPQLCNQNSRKLILNDAKSCSDSQLYDKVMMKLPDDKDLLESSATLTRTASGQCAVVLNKESKKAFVNHLRTYLSGSQGLIPIKRTGSGEITIALNSDSENNCGYGSLKITPSGNIYVTVDEKVFERIVKDVNHSEGTSLGDELSTHIIESIKSPVNKAVTTTCNAQPDNCSCDKSKCVCKELQLERNRWLRDHISESTKSTVNKTATATYHAKPDNCSCDPSKCVCKELQLGKNRFLRDSCMNRDSSFLKSRNYCIDLTNVRKSSNGGYKICDPQKCNEPRCSGSKSLKTSNKSPYIVIKPCDCQPVLAKNPRSEECCYVVEAICPYPINKLETLSHEMLEITGICNEALKNRTPISNYRSKNSYKANKERSWDSLKYLPPQLPKFLQDFTFP